MLNSCWKKKKMPVSPERVSLFTVWGTFPRLPLTFCFIIKVRENMFNGAVFAKACSKGVPTQPQHLGSTLIMNHTQSRTVQHKRGLASSSCGAESKPAALNITRRTSRALSSRSQRAEGKHRLTAAEIVGGIVVMFWETEEEQ